MKQICKILCTVLALCTVFVSGVSASAVKIYTYDEYVKLCATDGYYPQYPSMTGGKASIGWKGSAFKQAWENKQYEFFLTGGVESRIADTWGMNVNTEWKLSTSNVLLEDTQGDNEDPVLTFDYTATIDLVPDNEGTTAYDAMLVALYAEIDQQTGAKEYYESNTSGIVTGTIVGRQFVKYVPAGTVNGEEIFSSGTDVSVTLPRNFDPSKFAIGLAVWRVEDAPFEWAGYNLKYLVSPIAESSSIQLIDLSGFIDDFTVWIEPESELELDSVEYPSYSFSDELSSKEREYFTDLINNCSNSEDDPYTVKKVCFIDNLVSVVLPHNKDGHTVKRAVNSRIYAAIIDNGTGEVLKVNAANDKFCRQIFTLPDFFDLEKHRFVFFEYSYNTESEENEFRISRYADIDLKKYVFGDADKDGRINLTDITLMLKYIAGWESVIIDRDLLDDDIKNIYQNKNGYTLNKVSSVLKLIAGWPVDAVYPGYNQTLPDLCYHSGLRYYTENTPPV